jgi:hypothetical protein
VTFATNSSNVISSASTTSGGQSRTETRQVGFLGQLQLGWANRRFVQVGARMDDFSAFGTATPAIFLPKIGGSWVVSEEPWAAGLQRAFPSLRLRAAYGTSGRAPTAGAALQTLTPSAFAIQGSSGRRRRGPAPSRGTRGTGTCGRRRGARSRSGSTPRCSPTG